MRFRAGFVSNSSTTSFVVSPDQQLLVQLTELQQKLQLEQELHEIARAERDQALADLIALRKHNQDLERSLDRMCEEHARLSVPY